MWAGTCLFWRQRVGKPVLCTDLVELARVCLEHPLTGTVKLAHATAHAANTTTGCLRFDTLALAHAPRSLFSLAVAIARDQAPAIALVREAWLAALSALDLFVVDETAHIRELGA